MHGAYVHVPFCVKRCDYCAFATYTDRHHLTTRYLAAVKTQIARAIEAGMPRATSIFVGGGTPSMVPADELAAVITSASSRAGTIEGVPPPTKMLVTRGIPASIARSI